MAVDESSFPRGGAAPAAATASNKANLFDQMQTKKVTKNKIKKKKHNRVLTGAEPKLTALDDLSYRVLNEGMVVLGRITEITDYYLHVSLPGLTAGRVPVTQISEPYSQLLHSSGQNDEGIEALCPLSELFYKGQLVAAHVWQIRQTEDNKHHISLSLNPKVVHADWTHSSMAKKGLIINAAVKSIEEHGYVMDCGVNGLRSFLKEDKARSYCNAFNGGRPLAIGQLVRCVVTKAESSSTASKVELSANPDDIANEEEDGQQQVDMQLLLPGMRFKLTVSHNIKDGVEVNFHGRTGFIHRNHIPLLDSKEIEPVLEQGTTVFGRVLYITPLVNNVYFSALADITSTVKEIPKPSPAQVLYKIGDVVENGKVTGVGGKGLFLRFGKGHVNIRGFVPERRIGFNFKGKLADNDDEATMLQRLRTKFPLGSSIRCRLLFFDTMSGTYIGSMEKSVLEEKYLSCSDVKVGDVVPCVVEEVKNGGISITVGMVNGFVPAVHSADVPLIHPAKKFQPETKLSGRVLKVDHLKSRLIVTFKQSLVSSHDPIIFSYQSAKIGVCYSGTVVAITKNGAIVSFFGDVKGYLENNRQFVPAGTSLSVGQLIKCFVVRRNDKQLRLSMIAPTEFVPNVEATKHVKIGEMYTLEVFSVSANGLSVKVIDQGDSFHASGLVPVYHLSDDVEMAKLLLNTFEVGTVLANVWCFNDLGPKRPVVFSMRSSVIQFFKSTQGQIACKKSIEALTPGLVLPCSIRKVDSNFLLLEAPLSSVRTLIRVNSESVCDKGETIASLGYVEGQAIQAKITKLLEDKKSVYLDCRKKRVYRGDLETCIMHLSKHLSDQQRLLAHAKRIGNPLGDYSIGKGVSGVVTEQTEWGFVLRLSNGARGETTFYNAHSDNLEIGSQVEGKVLHVDCMRGHVEVTLRRDIKSTLKLYSSENLPSLTSDVQLRGPTLLATPEFILVQLKGAGKLNLAYIPTQLFPQGTSHLTVPEPFFGIDRKVIIKRFANRTILCLPKELVKAYKKKFETKKVKKLKVKKEKTEKFNQDRYFKNEDIKEEEEDDEEETQRIWNTEDESKIIDKDADDISDDESADLNEEETDSDIDFEVTKDSDAEKENLNQSDVLKARKRKPTSDSVEEMEPVSSSKKTKKENGSDIADSSKAKKKRKGNDEVSDNNTEDIKRLKKVGKEEKETVDLASDSESDSSSPPSNQTLKNPGFMWDIDPAKFMQVLEPGKQDSSSDEDESDDEKSKKKKRKKSAVERREAARLEEERLQKVEKELLDPNRQLTSCDDFDRMVLANPDSSAVWLQYMAFHLQATEIEKARAVAQRAIKSISYREEQEKLNIWLGLLNLENLYGTPETLKAALDQALQLNDAYKIRLHMVRLYAESSKNKELESEVRLVLKKFKETQGMWQELGAILMSQGYAEKARSILQQALQIVKNKKDSVDLIVHFALLEARNGHLEQAKALMDPILASYPKRTDIWCTYCDMLIKANQISEARELLERSVSQKLPAKKMKTLFTKYLQFEAAHGSNEGQDRVRKMAAEYVKNVAGDESVSND